VGPQLVVLALVGLLIDVAVGAVYISTGAQLAASMSSERTRIAFDRVVGVLFLVIAAALLVDVASH